MVELSFIWDKGVEGKVPWIWGAQGFEEFAVVVWMVGGVE